VGLIASIGRNRIKVVRKPNVAVLSTGDEIAEPGSKLGKNSIFDSNRYMISAMVKECGGESIDMGICPDDERLILTKLTKSLKLTL
jgi:molybdopterin molybdotransferase